MQKDFDHFIVLNKNKKLTTMFSKGAGMQHSMYLLFALSLLTYSTDAFIPSLTNLVSVRIKRLCCNSSLSFGLICFMQLQRHTAVDSTNSVIGLQCNGKDDSQSTNPKIIKLGTTKTSWQGWGSTTVKKAELKVISYFNSSNCPSYRAKKKSFILNCTPRFFFTFS